MTVRQYLRKAGGTALFVIGVVSLILPILPGLLFIALGLYILSIDSPKMRERTSQIRYRYKSFDAVMLRVDRHLAREVKKTAKDSPQIEG